MPQKYRINPIELVIFGVVSLMLFHSLYNLFYEKHVLESGTLTATSEDHSTTDRALASTQSFQNFEIKCLPRLENDTQAAKIRLTGPLCGLVNESQHSAKLVKTQVTNQTNRFSATVFTDLSAGKFSTDYIPLDAGKNQILIEFIFDHAKTFKQETVINRLGDN